MTDKKETAGKVAADESSNLPELNQSIVVILLLLFAGYGIWKLYGRLLAEMIGSIFN